MQQKTTRVRAVAIVTARCGGGDRDKAARRLSRSRSTLDTWLGCTHCSQTVRTAQPARYILPVPAPEGV